MYALFIFVGTFIVTLSSPVTTVTWRLEEGGIAPGVDLTGKFDGLNLVFASPARAPQR
jgi:hypothetical protein